MTDSPVPVEFAEAVGRKLGELAGRTHRQAMAKLDAATARLEARQAEFELRLERAAAEDRARLRVLEAQLAAMLDVKE